MTTVLLILKILGIILASVAGFCILLLILASFSPVKYSLKAFGKDKDISVSLSAKWLFGLAFAKAKFERGVLSYKAGILGINFLKEKPEKKEEELEEADTAEEAEEIIKEEDKGDVAVPVKVFFNKIKAKALALLNKIKEIHEKAKLIKFIIEAPATKRALSACKIRIFNLLNHIKPYIIKGDITIGFDDAAYTAIVYGILGCAAFALSQDNLKVRPDYENSGIILKKVIIRGRINIYYAAAQILGVLFNKDVQRVVRKIRRSF